MLNVHRSQKAYLGRGPAGSFDDRCYIALFSALEQTPCVCDFVCVTRFYVYILFVSLFEVCLLLFVNIHRSDVLTVLTWLMPHKNCCRRGAFCVHHTTMHHVTSCKLSHIRKVHACLAVTYHLHFCQNDRSFTCFCSNTGVERLPK